MLYYKCKRRNCKIEYRRLKRGDIIRYEKKDGVVVTLERLYTKADYKSGGKKARRMEEYIQQVMNL